MSGRPVIQYIFPVVRMIEFSKSWVPTGAHLAYDDGGYFSARYSKVQMDEPSGTIRKTAMADAKDYSLFVQSGLENFGIPPQTVKRALDELPDGDDLFNLVMSYRIYDTLGKKRVRVPSASRILEYNINVKRKNKNK